MTDNNKNKKRQLETDTQEQIKAMAKALIVSMAWSGTELLDKKTVKDGSKNPERKPLDEQENLGKDR
ncbi:MAG: hypothetical protein SXA11_15715 [Cyanobacteriota bacterium]|nr:hypothetical protein [Cyanobacteriota bacterium]